MIYLPAEIRKAVNPLEIFFSSSCLEISETWWEIILFSVPVVWLFCFDSDTQENLKTESGRKLFRAGIKMFTFQKQWTTKISTFLVSELSVNKCKMLEKILSFLESSRTVVAEESQQHVLLSWIFLPNFRFIYWGS